MKVKSHDAFRLQVPVGTLRPRHFGAQRAGVPVRNEGMWEIKKEKKKHNAVIKRSTTLNQLPITEEHQGAFFFSFQRSPLKSLHGGRVRQPLTAPISGIFFYFIFLFFFTEFQR